MIWIQSNALAATTASTDNEPASAWVEMILRELGRSEAGGFVAELVKWTAIGALAGVVLAAAVWIGCSRMGWHDLSWRFARFVRWTICALTIFATAALLGLAGFWNGALHGSERVLTRSQLATEVFPRIGDVIADGMAWLQLEASAGKTADPATAEAPAGLEEFREGKRELNAADFLRQVEQLQADAITDVLDRLEQTASERLPQLEGGLGQKLLHGLLTGLGRSFAEKKVTSELKRWGADRVYFALREGLTAEAGKSGHPETLSRAEISGFVVREGVVPGILNPIRSMARSNQLLLLLVAGMVLAVPPLALRVLSRLTRSASPSTAAPPPIPQGPGEG